MTAIPTPVPSPPPPHAPSSSSCSLDNNTIGIGRAFGSVINEFPQVADTRPSLPKVLADSSLISPGASPSPAVRTRLLVVLEDAGDAALIPMKRHVAPTPHLCDLAKPIASFAHSSESCVKMTSSPSWAEFLDDAVMSHPGEFIFCDVTPVIAVASPTSCDKASPEPCVEPLHGIKDKLTLCCKTKKRKTSHPSKAVTRPVDEADRVEQGIVILDVYSLYLLHPTSLLSSSRGRRGGGSRGGRRMGNTTRARASSRSSPPPFSWPVSSFPPHPPPSSVGSVQKGVDGDVCFSPGQDLDDNGLGLSTSGLKMIKPDFPARKHTRAAGKHWSEFTDTEGAPKVYWKGAMLKISETAEGYHLLTKEEIRTCSALRILPAQYLNMKKVLLTAVENRGPFRKREAQTWFRIDVNKTCLIYDWFRSLEWIPSFEEWPLQLDSKARDSAIVVPLSLPVPPDSAKT